MNIGIDIDDTIANTFEVMFAYSQKYTAEDLKRSDKIIELEDIKTHFYCQAMHSWSKEEEIEFFKQVVKNSCDLFYKYAKEGGLKFA